MPVAAAVWEVRTTGSNTNGGAFVAGASGTDYSQQDSAQVAVTDAVANGTTTITSATAGFTSAHVGNVIYLTGGSGSLAATRRSISSVTNSTTIVVNASVASGTGITLNLGGACATPAEIFARGYIGQNIGWVKTGTYGQTATLVVPTGVAGRRTCLFGYNNTRGDLDGVGDFSNHPVLQNVNTTNAVISGSSHCRVANFVLDGGSGPSRSTQGCNSLGSWAIIENCEAINWTTQGFNGVTAVRCLSTQGRSGADSAFVNCNAYHCVAANNPCLGFRSTGSFHLIGCISYGNTGAGFSQQSGGGGDTCISCIAFGNTSDGWRITGANGALSLVLRNCISYGNGGFGINALVGGTNNLDGFSDWNAFGANTSGARNGYPAGDNDVTLTTDPFTNSAAGDFSLNDTAGGGAALRATGFPGVMPDGLTTGYADIGAVQHQDSGGGGAGISGSRIFTGF